MKYKRELPRHKFVNLLLVHQQHIHPQNQDQLLELHITPKIDQAQKIP